MKGDLTKYSHSVFIRRLTEHIVSFQTPARPRLMFLVAPKEYISQVRMESIGRTVPRADARWISAVQSRLSKADKRCLPSNWRFATLSE